MKLPRTQTGLAAALLAAAPLALLAPQTSRAQSTRPPVTPPAAASAGKPSTAYPPATLKAAQSPVQAMGAKRPYRMSTVAVPGRDLTAARGLTVSLTQAIGTAERASHGKAVGARFELLHGRPEYMVKTFDRQQDREWIGHVDARSGRLLGRGRSLKTTRLLPEDQQELTAANAASTSLMDAVRKAEQHVRGKALAAGMSARHGAITYRTEILKKNGVTQMAAINPKSGKVTAYR